MTTINLTNSLHMIKVSLDLLNFGKYVFYSSAVALNVFLTVSKYCGSSFKIHLVVFILVVVVIVVVVLVTKLLSNSSAFVKV